MASGRCGDFVLDALRGLAIILVVVGHVINGFNYSNLSFTGNSLIHDTIYSFHMPLMFMVSGYADGMRQKSSAILKQIRKSIVSVYLPCLYFSFMIWLPKFLWSALGISNPENFRLVSIDELLAIPLHGFDLYWFLCALFFIKIIHILTEHFMPSWKLRAILWAAAFSLYAFGAGIHSFCHYGIYFFVGYELRRQNIITRETHPGIFWGIIMLLAGMMIFSASYFYGGGNKFTEAGAALCTSLALFVMFYACDVRGAFLACCGAGSMVIYVLHNHVIALMRIIFRTTGISESVNAAVLFVICSAVGLLLPCCVIWLYRNVKCLRWLQYIFYPGKLIFRK